MTMQSDGMVLPKYVSAEQVMLEWLKQPGNYERFVQAGAEGKRQGRVSESKRDVAASICTLLKNAGIYDRSPHAVSIKLCVWVRQYKRAQAVAASGASQTLVRRAFPHYYDLVDHLDGGNGSGGGTQGLHFIRASKPSDMNHLQRHPVTGMREQGSNIILGEEMHARHYQLMNQLLQQQQQILEQQARRDRLQELELQAALIERMTEAGFTKEEIGEHLEKLR
ncbi:predicted protein [Lichtheimia corymbifera JMRC:FSU:9682]|uniref:Uncharacterized protein n=1 Tax=Lichtheimia corymbifera JMRC:FSU:9682 TaxID=1263082 RepID=A0A068SFX1_9FUNG|nr:predicted protein [Lichtheimia corymbifera JMRC:FSU:9682]